MSELSGLPKGYTKKLLTIRCSNTLGAGLTTGDLHFILNETIYNVVYAEWVSVSHTPYATPSTLLGRFIQVEQFRNDGQFTKSGAVNDTDFRYWAYIDSQSNQSNQPFPDDMFPMPKNIHELNIRVWSATKGNVDCSNQLIVIALWCKTS